MGSVALNRSLQIYIQLQSRNLTLSWFRRGCSSSSGTVRCIQSDSSTPQIKKSPVPVSLASLRKQKSKEESCDGTAPEQLETVCENVSEKGPTKAARLPKKRNQKQVAKDVDLKHPTSACRNASENRLLKPVTLDENCSSEEKEISENEISKSTFEDARKVAIELLAGRAFSVAELRKKLRSKKFPLQVVDKVIADIEARGLVNDGLYAETFSRSRWLSAAWGPRRIKQALLQKGVSEADVAKATRKVFEDNDDCYNNGTNHNHDQENSHPYESESNNTQLIMSESSMNRLFIQASKQWLRGEDLSIDRRKARVIRWLQYRGFNWGVVTIILQRLQSQFTSIQDNDNINDIRNNGRGGRANKEVEETISEESMDKLLVEVSKRWTKGQNVSIENRKARIARWLRYRGYSWDVVGVVLKRLLSQ